MPIRLIATDLDGTLLHPDGAIAPRTLDAIRDAAAAGIEVVAATGRSFRTAGHRVEPAREIRLMVCSNGGLVYDMHARVVASLRVIDGPALRSLVAQLRTAEPHLKFGWESIEGFGLEPGFGDRPGDAAADDDLMGGPQRLDDVERAIKLFVAHDSVQGLALQRFVEPILPKGFTGSTSGAPFVEVTAPGVDKASTLALLASERGIDASEVLAIGDQMNDAAMLSWAGVAVAMGNAVPEIRAMADRVTASCEDGGAADVIAAVAAGTSFGELP